MTSSLEALRWERRRKLQVRESFSRGLEHFRRDPAATLPFILACADYLVAGQRRLVDQDRRLVDLLAPRVPEAQRDDHAAMDALRSRLDLADRVLAEFADAVSQLRRRGVAGATDFDAAATRFLDVLVNVLGARSHSLRHLTTTLLDENDWSAIVGSSPDFAAAESAAYAEIGRLAPPGLEPEAVAGAARA